MTVDQLEAKRAAWSAAKASARARWIRHGLAVARRRIEAGALPVEWQRIARRARLSPSVSPSAAPMPRGVK
jgi:hypothetical protein